MAWVAVSEATTAHGKQQSITRITRTVTTVAMLTGGAAIAAPPAVNQLPTGGQVAAGIAAIGVSGNTMTVTQSSNRAAINWNTFDIGSQAAVNFVQPSSNAVALNRVLSNNPSQIFGQLSSNGQVYLINAAGVYFAPGAQVNVGGIVATTMQMSDAAFMAGSTTFERNGSTGKVINEGTIQTSLNGYIAMLAPEVRNSGLLLAQSGTVAMGAGERITLNFGPTSKLDSITVTEAQLDTLVENRSAIKAPNGLVILSARAANQLAASVVNSGTIEAKGVSQQGGRILLEGSTVTNTGTLDVSSDTAQAGTIQINGKNVSISGNVIATSTAQGTATQGGTIKVSATQSLNATNANINASTINGTGGGAPIVQGGSIELSAHQISLSDSSINADGDQGGTVQITAASIQQSNPFHDPLNIPTLPATLAATGFTSISSRGRRGQGGNVTLTGDGITLDGNTNINVSGAFGGGNALIGGDWQGSNGTYQATTVYMGTNTSIDASATDTGNGGKVVLWSDVTNPNSTTEAHGTILARGGVNGGDGGKIETSGYFLNTDNAVVDAGALQGNGGLWLLDPYDYTISSASYINTALNSGTNVTIDTANSSSMGGNYSGSYSIYGNITISDNISKTAGAAATLTLNANNLIGGAGNIGSTGNALSVVFNTGGGTGIYTGVISGNVSITKSGAGMLDLIAANTYTGGTTINAGTLGVYTNSAMGAGAVTVAGDSSLLLGRGVTSIANNFTLNANMSVSYDTNVDYLIVAGGGSGGVGRGGGGGAGGVLQGSTQLTSTSYSITVGDGGASVTSDHRGLSGGNTTALGLTAYGGGGGGGWIAGEENGLNGGSGGGTSGSGSSAAIAGQGTPGQGNNGYDVNVYQNPGGGGGGAGAAATSQNGGVGIQTNITGSSLWVGGGGGAGAAGSGAGSGGSGGGGAGTSVGNGTATSGTANTGGGGGGTDGINGQSGAGGSGVVYVRYLGSSAGTGGTVSSGTGTAAGYTLHTFTTTGSSTLSLNALATTFSGTISGTGGKFISNASGGTITLTGSNTYSGGTTINYGTLATGNAAALGTGAVSLTNNSGALLQLNTALNVSSIAGGGSSGGNIALGSYTLTTGDSTSTSYGGVISGTGSVIKAGSGTLTLSGTNSYSGTTNVSAGTLAVSGYLSDSTAVNVSSGASYNVSSSDTVASITGAGTINLGTGYTLTSGGGGSTTFSGVIAGAGGLTKGGASTTLTLTGTNTYSGTTTVSAGTLMVGNGTANGSVNVSSNIAISSGATLALNRSDALTFANNMSGAGGITITQANAVNLTGAAAYTGNTTVGGGALTFTGTNVPTTSNITGTGTVLIQPASPSFGSAQTFSANVTNGITSLTIGSSTNTANLTVSGNVNVSGPISLYGGTVTLSSSLTSNGTGDIWIQANSDALRSIWLSGNIYKTGGARSNITLRANGSIYTIGSNITATNTNGTNIILWSDYGNTNNGGVEFGNLTSNGGNIWVGGSNTAGGSTTWNGLTVGNGPAVGSYNQNWYPVDFDGTITSAGGDVLIWAGAGYNSYGLGIPGTRTISAGSGNIILLTNQIYNINSGNGILTLNSTGKLTFAPADGAWANGFSLTGNYWSPTTLTLNNIGGTGQYVDIQNIASLTGLTIGQYTGMSGLTQGNTGNVTVGSTVNISGPISLYGGNVSVNAAMNSTASGKGILLEALGQVTDSANLTTNGGDITFWSNSNGGTTGGIVVNNNVTLTSGGGWITMGGSAGNVSISGLPATSALGTALPQGYAKNVTGTIVGLSLGTVYAGAETANVTINSGNGRIGLAGESSLYVLIGGSSYLSFGLVAYNAVNINSGSGDLVVNGLASGSPGNATSTSWGIVTSPWSTPGGALGTSTWKTNGGNISINGVSTALTGTGAGIDMQGSDSGSLLTIENTNAASGNLTLSGSSTGSTTNYGIQTHYTNLLSASGAINLNVASGTFNAPSGNVLNIGSAAATDVTSSTAVVTITADTASFAGTNNINTSGTVTVQPYGNSFSSTLIWPIGSLSLGNTVSGLTLGKISNTADITISSTTNVNGSINLYGGNLSLNADMTANGASSWLSLYASGNVTQAAGKVLNNKVRFTGGGGNITLGNTVNQIQYFSATGVANVTVNNSYASAALGLMDISATGSIKILDTAGLALNGNISTTSTANSTSAPALLLAAGYDQPAGNSGGAYSVIAVNGTCCSVTVGNGGLGLIYTGTVANTWNINSIVASGSGHFRYNTNTSYSLTGATPGFNVTAAPLTVNASASNLYVLYREQPTLTINATSASTVYGTAVNATPTTTAANGDTLAQIFGSANVPTETVGGTKSAAGYYTAGNHTLNITAASTTNYLGYATPTYNNGTATVTKANLTVAGTVVADKQYDGNTTANFTNSGSISPLTGPNGTDVVALTTSGVFSSKNAANGVVVTMSDSISGADAANYNIVQPTVNANITPKTVTLSDTQGYSGSNTLTNVTIGGLVGSETLTYTGATANSSHVADNATNYITAITLGDQAGANATSGGLASNYQLPSSLNHTSAPVTITAVNVTLTATGNISRAYDGSANATVGGGNYTFSGLISGDTGLTLNNLGSAVYNSPNVTSANNVTVSGLTLASITGNHSSATSDYNLLTTSLIWGAGGQTSTYANITAPTLSITANSTNMQYGLGTNLSTLGYVATGLVNSETIGNVTLASAGSNVSSNVGSYNITAANATGGTFTASNYNISYVNGTLNVTAAPLTLTAANLSRAYGASNPTTDTVVVTGTLYNGNTVGNATVSTSATGTTAAGQTANLTPSAVAFTNGSSGNYNITYVNGTLSITQAQLGIAYSGTYNGASGFNNVNSGYTFTGLQNGETITSANIAIANANVAFANNYVTGLTVLTGNASMSNYVLNTAYNSAAGNTRNTVTLAAAPLTITAQAANMTYNGTGYSGGNVSYSGFVGSDTSASMNGTITYGGNSQGAINAGAYTITASGQTNSNYIVTYNSGVLTINPAPLGIAAAGVYSGSTTVSPTSYTLTGLVNGETITSIASVTLNNANVAATTNGTQYITGIGGTNGTANLANYQINGSRNATTGANNTNVFTMARANLTVTPNNGAIFIGEALPANGSYTVSYNGLVGGQTAAGLITAGTLTAGNVSNSAGNPGNTTVPAGSYNLTASGWSADNYALHYTNGSFVVSPADALIVQVGSQSMTYGANLTTTAGLYGTPTVRYMANGSAAVTLIQNVSQSSGNHYVYNDGMGGSVTFNLSVVNGSYSTSNNLNAGSGYQLTSANIAVAGPNLNLTNGTTTTGAMAVNAMNVTASTSNVSKQYDGTRAMNGLTIDLTPAAIAGDDVSTAGSGAFSQANAGTNLSYTLSNLALTGADAANYVLTGGTSASGTNGIITPRTVTLSANQTYSGNTTLTNVTIGNLVGTETLTYSAGTANSKNVQDNGTNYITGLTLGNGANGGLSSNYQLPTLNHTNAPVTINRLNSVTWTGGASGNWFDPANWAGGAVPDLNNVANVVLPAGVTVYFNNTIVPPAQAGTVSVDSITGASANLSQSAGNLSVGLGGITLYTLNQSNGTLTSLGPINLTSYIQSGGNLTANSNFTTISFDQSGGITLILGALNATNYTQSNGTTTVNSLTVNGSYNQIGGQTNVTGSANITTVSTMTLGNLTVGGTLNAHSTGGSINQTAGTQMSVTGRASFYAPNGVISLNPNNSFPGGNSIIDHNGDRNKPAYTGDPWIFQQTMVQGGTVLYIPLPKTQVGESRKTHTALAFTGDVILLADDAPEKGTDPGFMATPEAGFTDRFFDTAPRMTLLPTVHTAKVVQHGDRLLIVDTDGPRLKPVGEEGLTLPKPGLQLSTPDDATPGASEKISYLD